MARQSGDGALANVALDRALADEPRYSMAHLLSQVITAGTPPSLARLPMTPEEVAASYDEAEDDAYDEAEDDAYDDEEDDAGDDLGGDHDHELDPDVHDPDPESEH